MTEVLAVHGINYSAGTDMLIANRAGTFKEFNNTTLEWDNVTSFSWSADYLIDSTNFLDHAFFVNGNDTNRSRNSSGTWSTTTNLTDAPLANRIRAHNLRIYLGGVKINSTWYRSRVWFSDLPKNGQITWGLETGTDLSQSAGSAVVTSSGAAFIARNIKVGDPFVIEDGANAGEYVVRSIDSATQITLTTNLASSASNSTFWVGGNFFDVNTDDGDIVVGFGGNANELLIFKKLSAHRFNDSAQTLRQIKRDPGTTSFRSVVDLNEYTYYYDSKTDAIRRYDSNSSRAMILSNAIEDILPYISDSMRENVVGWSHSGKIVEFYLGDITTRDGFFIRNCVVSWDTITQTWSTRSLPFTVEASGEWERNDKFNTYVGTSNAHILKVNDGNNYDGKAIGFIMQDSPIFPVGHDTAVTFESIRLLTEGASGIQVMARILYMPDPQGIRWSHSDWFSLKGTADSDMVEFVFPNNAATPRRGTGVQFRFLESSQEKTFLIEEYIVYYSSPAIR